ncbi:MAG: hypothetical protein AB1646_25605 [Thermodesulfobacteriota bacterium]
MIARKAHLLCVLVGCLIGLTPAWGESPAGLVDAMVKSRAEVKPVTLPSLLTPGLNIEKAYAIQKDLIKALVAKGDKVCGFKAALTSEATQKRFGVDRALLAPLLKSGEVMDGAVLEKKDFVMPMIENEIGFVAGKRITSPVKDVAALKELVTEVFPAIEFPDLRYAQMKDLKGPDLVADATGSSKHLVGKKIPATQADVAAVEVTLTCDGAEINRGKAADAMGDQWKALLWLVNGAIEQGWTVEPGYVFITGDMGKMLPAKPGTYKGDYGSLGSLSFTIK